MEMTISQCLRRIAKLKGEMKELLARAQQSVSYDEAAPPAFSFVDTMKEIEKTREELIKLETLLRVTNAWTEFKFGGRTLSLAEATVILQEHKARIAWLKALPCKAQAKTSSSKLDYDDEGERVKVTVNTICALPEAERAKQVKDTQEAFDALNDVVENLNHKTPIRA